MTVATTPRYESTLALCACAGHHRTSDAGAGAAGDVLVVAGGLGGHGTGWIPARLAVRTLCERAAAAGAPPRYVGVADALPTEWGWAGALQDDEGARLVYAACEALVATDWPDVGLDLALGDLDRAIERIPSLPYRFSGPVTACTAIRAHGDGVVGAHVGVSRALLVRAGSPALECPTVEHYLHEVVARRPEDYAFAGAPEALRHVIVGALGGMARAEGMVAVETFAAALAVGDAALLCSRRLPLADEEVSRRLRRLHDVGTPLADVADELAEAVRAAPDLHHDTAFAILRRIG